MLPGYNHNLRHQDILFHIQTEDTGVARAIIETHVFIDGNIIATRRANYGKFVSRAGMSEIVKSMMQEQHKQMMKDLVDGKILSVNQYLASQGRQAGQKKAPQEPLAAKPAQSPPGVAPPPPPSEPPDAEKTLDELILEHLRKNRGVS